MQLVAGSRVSPSTDDGFALVLSDSGDVYSWGKGYKGRLGHSSSENIRSPKMVDALGGKDIKMVTYFHNVCMPFGSAHVSVWTYVPMYVYSKMCIHKVCYIVLRYLSTFGLELTWRDGVVCTMFIFL